MKVYLSCEGVDALVGIEDDARDLLAAAQLEDGELSIVLCGDGWIRRLNAEWRGMDATTDVLSFPQEDEVVLGDLVVSLHTAARQAEERGCGLRDEVRVLLVHGLLHLLGYDHDKGERECAKMAAAERKLLDRLAWKGEGLIASTHGA